MLSNKKSLSLHPHSHSVSQLKTFRPEAPLYQKMQMKEKCKTVGKNEASWKETERRK